MYRSFEINVVLLQFRQFLFVYKTDSVIRWALYWSGSIDLLQLSKQTELTLKYWESFLEKGLGTPGIRTLGKEFQTYFRLPCASWLFLNQCHGIIAIVHWGRLQHFFNDHSSIGLVVSFCFTERSFAYRVVSSAIRLFKRNRLKMRNIFQEWLLTDRRLVSIAAANCSLRMELLLFKWPRTDSSIVPLSNPSSLTAPTPS